ncbi:MAG: thioesterase family protein [Desulfobacterales bacterium]|nr:thioesterase family protein [Desulfobacterales bacterium]
MHLFEQDIHLSPDGESRYTARVSDNWSINGTPDGGYLMALLARAAMAHSKKKGLSVLTANFIARSEPGPAELIVSKMGATRNFDRWQVSLAQNQAEKLRSMVTLMNPAPGQAGQRYEKHAPMLAPAETCIKFGEMSGYTLFDNMDVLLDPGCSGWIAGDLDARSELRGWIKFRDDRPFDPPALMLIADAFPPPIFVSQGMVAWVPTIELSVNIRNLPDTRWLKCVFRSRFLNGGMVEEDGEIWDEAGELVAISRQIAQYRKT